MSKQGRWVIDLLKIWSKLLRFNELSEWLGIRHSFSNWFSAIYFSTLHSLPRWKMIYMDFSRGKVVWTVRLLINFAASLSLMAFAESLYCTTILSTCRWSWSKVQTLNDSMALLTRTSHFSVRLNTSCSWYHRDNQPLLTNSLSSAQWNGFSHPWPARVTSWWSKVFQGGLCGKKHPPFFCMNQLPADSKFYSRKICVNVNALSTWERLLTSHKLEPSSGHQQTNKRIWY